MSESSFHFDGGIWGVASLIVAIGLILLVIMTRWPNAFRQTSGAAPSGHATGTVSGTSVSSSTTAAAHSASSGSKQSQVSGKGVLAALALIILAIWLYNGGWQLITNGVQPVFRDQPSSERRVGSRGSNATQTQVVVTETPPASGNGHMLASSAARHSSPVDIPLGWQLCTIADNGSGSYQWQFHPRNGPANEWIDAPDSRSNQAHQVRHKSKGAAQDFAYYFVRQHQPC